MQLKDKVAIITGAASGIGKEIAMVFAKAQAKVAIADLNLDQAQEVADILGKDKAMAVAMNVTDEQQVQRGVDQVVEKFGHVDVLVSNAGIQIIDSIDKISFSNWKKLLSIHLDGAFLTTRACLKHMYASKRGGSIIYMGSVSFQRSFRFKRSLRHCETWFVRAL